VLDSPLRVDFFKPQTNINTDNRGTSEHLQPTPEFYKDQITKHTIKMAALKAFAPPPPPKSALGYYRVLAPNAAVKVSPLCLGAMNFGESW
jgi:hypothetical protein